jgi:hypothetical protein
MSLSAMSEDKSVNAGAGSLALSAPRLRSGAEYSAWAPSMDVFLQRAGAESIHKKASTRESWVTTSARVALWADEEMARAMQLALDDGAGSSSDTAVAQTFGLRRPLIFSFSTSNGQPHIRATSFHSALYTLSLL